MQEDELLIRQIKLGNSEAMGRLYEKYESELLSLAVNLLGDPAGAEDCLQDVFVSFAKAVDRFVLRSSLKAYLSTCVANRSRDYFRFRKRRPQQELSREIQSYSKGPVQLAIQSEELQRLGKVMCQLPYQQREVVILYLQGGLKFKQIAGLQEVSVKTVQSRYRYGLTKLRSLFNGEVEK